MARAHATGHLILALLILWSAFAIWFSPLPTSVLRLTLAIAFVAFGIWVNDAARAAGSAQDFSERICVQLGKRS